MLFFLENLHEMLITIIVGLWNGLWSAYLASRAKAKTPAASGAAADVPEWRSVQFPYRSVVA